MSFATSAWSEKQGMSCSAYTVQAPGYYWRVAPVRHYWSHHFVTSHRVAFSNKPTSLHVASVLGCDATRNKLWTISSQHSGTRLCNQSLKPKTKKAA